MTTPKHIGAAFGSSAEASSHSFSEPQPSPFTAVMSSRVQQSGSAATSRSAAAAQQEWLQALRWRRVASFVWFAIFSTMVVVPASFLFQLSLSVLPLPLVASQLLTQLHFSAIRRMEWDVSLRFMSGWLQLALQYIIIFFYVVSAVERDISRVGAPWVVVVLPSALIFMSYLIFKHLGSRQSDPCTSTNMSVESPPSLPAGKPMTVGVSPATTASFRFPAVEEKRRSRMLRDSLHVSVGMSTIRVVPLFAVLILVATLVVLPILAHLLSSPWLVRAAAFFDAVLCARIIAAGWISSVSLLLAFTVPSTILSEHISISSFFSARRPARLSRISVSSAADLRPDNRNSLHLYISALKSKDDPFLRVHAMKDIAMLSSFSTPFRRALFEDATQLSWKQLFDNSVARIDELTQSLQLNAMVLSDPSQPTRQLSSAGVLFGQLKVPVFRLDFSVGSLSVYATEVAYAIHACARLVVASRYEDTLGIVNVSKSAPYLLESLLSLQLVLDSLGAAAAQRQRLGLFSRSLLQRQLDSSCLKATSELRTSAPTTSGHICALPTFRFISERVSEAIHSVLFEFYEELFKLHDFRPDHQCLLQYYADVLMN